MKWIEKEGNLPACDPDGAAKSRQQLEGRIFWRKELSDILKKYNTAIGNDSAALEQVEAFRKEDSVCVVTGQQLGLFGGPSYTILKAISCLILARQQGAVPIFWLATEDHDVDEIDHTYLIDTLGNLSKFHLSLPKDGRFVEELHLTQAHQEVFEKFFDAVNHKEMIDQLKGETSYTRAMVRILVSMFKGTGLVFVEPHLLRPLAKSFFAKEITDCDSISQVLQETTKKVEKPQLDVSQGTNLFLKMDGKFRVKIQRDKDQFLVGKQTLSEEELLKLIENEPERFSTNAQARCVLQNLLFPVLAYVAGPGEIAYYQQLPEYHQLHGISVPWIIPRISATLITPQAQEMLEKCRLEPWEEIPHHWPQVIPNIESGVEELTQEWMQSAMSHFNEELSTEALQRFIRLQAREDVEKYKRWVMGVDEIDRMEKGFNIVLQKNDNQAILADLQQAGQGLMQEKEPYVCETLLEMFGLQQETFNDWYTIGAKLFNEKDYEKALCVFILLTNLNHLVFDPWLGMGICWQIKGNDLEALRSFSMASLVDFEHPAPHLHSAEVYMRVEEPNLARKTLELALSKMDEESKKGYHDRIQSLESQIKGGNQ